MCILYKGFRGFRAVLPASILSGNLTGLKHAISNDTIQSALGCIVLTLQKMTTKERLKICSTCENKFIDIRLGLLCGKIMKNSYLKVNAQAI